MESAHGIMWGKRRPSAASLLQEPLSVDYGSNNNFVVLYPINDAVAVDEQLANVFVIEFGDLTAGAGELRKYSGLAYDLL